MSDHNFSRERRYGVQNLSFGYLARCGQFFVQRLASTLLVALLVFAGVDTQAKIGVQYQLLLGNPSNATTTTNNSTNYLIERDQFTFSYNNDTRQANWVSWNFTMADRGPGERRDNFIPDPLLPAGYNVVQGNGYSGSGYDRGHMSPSADRTATQADNDMTFIMTNMVPQHPDNNQGVWANFENETRAIAAQGGGNEMLIICGPSLFPGTQIASGVKIPGYVWKIVLVVPIGSDPNVPAVDRINASTRVIAIKIPNIAGVRSDPWSKYLTSIAQIEADTGFTFLTSLSPSVAAALRTKVDGQVVTGAPAIAPSGQPANQTVAVGGTANFSVTATGNATLSYQWFKGEDAIVGATSTTLTVSNVQASSVGLYNVIVTNSVGSATSNNAELIVTGLPPSITTPPTAQTNAAGSTAIFTVAVTGTSPFTYQWRKNSSNITGNASATTASLTLPNVQSGDIGLYDVVITNNVSSVTSAQVTLAVNPAAPTISTQPTSRSVGPNGATTFNVVASGTAPLTYQWRKDGSNLTGIASATTASLILTNVQTADQGNYDVVVTNSINTVTSNAASLTISLTAGGVIAYTGGTYTQDFNSLPSVEAGTAAYSLPGVGPHALDAAPVSATNLGGWSISRAGGTGNTLFAVSPGTSLSGAIYSYGSIGSTERAIGSIASNSNPAPRFGVTFVNNTDQTISSITVNFMTEQWRRGDGGVNKATGAYSIGATDLNTGTYINALALDITAPVITGSAVALDGNAAANRAPATATLTGLTWAPGDRLVLRWTDINDALSDDSISMDDFSFTAQLVAPIIDTQPVAQTVAAGSNVMFAVVASGPGTLRYQWRKGTTPITGNPSATTSLLSLTNVQAADAGNYNVVVTNAGGSVTSSDVALTLQAGFASWQAENFTTEEQSNLAVSGPNAVYGQDGLTNLVKYALGLLPKVNATVGLPEITTTASDWIYTYTRPADRSDVTYTVERSIDLTTWSTTSVTHELVSTAGGIETWRGRVPLTVGDKLFFRLTVVRP
ncbi:DNA/RNA non-specific endonuclease [Oleiharenicola lentus]|uniref:DNA/RNA non-specific endonuclease n=1 Tax=Oleiharenicola lentus TaxID=2508720 RepID=UPI003F67BBD2